MTASSNHIRVGILGASGYTGAELIRLLAQHPSARITLLTGDRAAGKPLGDVFPHLAYLDSPKAAALENMSEDLTLATRDALIKIIDWMVREKGLTREQAYVVAAAAVDLRIGQLVDVPNFMVSAVLPLDIFDA